MKKWLIVFMLVLFASAVQAQTGLMPTALFPIADLGIELPVPSSWSYREADGVYFAASESDLDLATDGNPNSVPTSPVMQLAAVTLNDLATVTALPLQRSFDTVARQLGFQISGEAMPSSVLGHLSLTGFGTVNNAGLILTVWIQGESLVVLTLTTPDATTANANARDWGTILGNIKASDALDLDRRVTSTYGFEVAYPQAWTPVSFENNGLFGVFETSADAQLVLSGSGTTNITATSFVVSFNRFADLSLTDQSTPADLGDILSANLGLSDQVTQGEFYVNGTIGTGLYGQMPNGRWLYVVGTLDTDQQVVLFYMLAAPNETALSDLMPTFWAMLHSTNQDLSALPTSN